MKFKVGDIVKVIRSGRGVSLENIGRKTVITEIGRRKYNNFDAVKTRDLDNPDFEDWINEDSFVLVKKKTIKPYNIVNFCKKFYE